MRTIMIALAAGILAATPAAAQTSIYGSDGVITGEEVLAGVISEIERRVIGHYYKGDAYKGGRGSGEYGRAKKKKGKSKELPPGLAKRDHLPPGLQKQLDERGALPPGLAKRALPHDLRSALPRRIHEEFVIVDDDVLLIERATGVVLDIILGGAKRHY